MLVVSSLMLTISQICKIYLISIYLTFSEKLVNHNFNSLKKLTHLIMSKLKSQLIESLPVLLHAIHNAEEEWAKEIVMENAQN